MTRGGKRLVWRIAVSLAVGVVLTVAVAWGCVVAVPLSAEDYVDLPADPWPYPWPVPVGPDWPRGAMNAGVAEKPGKQLEFASHKGQLVGDPDAASGMFWVELMAVGFPLRCMRSESRYSITMHTRQETETVSGLKLPESSLPEWLEERQLPLTIVWPGFALNTIFYGGIVSLLWSAPGLIRLRSRGRRGLCTACGYDLRSAAGDVCPECGSESPRPGVTPGEMTNGPGSLI